MLIGPDRMVRYAFRVMLGSGLIGPFPYRGSAHLPEWGGKHTDTHPHTYIHMYIIAGTHVLVFSFARPLGLGGDRTLKCSYSSQISFHWVGDLESITAHPRDDLVSRSSTQEISKVITPEKE